MNRDDAAQGDDSPLEGRQEDFFVTLPCPPEEFAEFIAGLLGHPQIISRRIAIPFKLDFNAIHSLHHLLRHRVEEQNDAIFGQFTITIFYDDGSEIRINSYDDFRTFRETRPQLTIAVEINWVFVIRFQGKHYPQRQEINLKFCTRDYAINRILRKRRDLVIVDTTQDELALTYGYVDVSVNFTARSWGSDIDNVLKNEILGLAQKENAVVRFLNHRYATVGWWTVLLLAFAGGFALIKVAEIWQRHSFAVSMAYLEGLEVDEMIRHSLSMIMGGNPEVGIIPVYDNSFILFLMLPVGLLAFWLGRYFARSAALLHRSGMILITRTDEEYADQRHRRAQRATVLFLCGQVLGVFGSFAGSLYVAFLY